MLKLRRRRLRCPEHGVLAESVPFARPGSGFSTDFEDLAVWLATKCDKKTVSVFCRVAWRTVGAMCARVAAEEAFDPDRLAGLVDIGVDEISWRKHHKYLTLVSDHDTATIVWGAPDKTAATLDRFFTEALPESGAARIEAVSMDLGPAFVKSVRAHAPQAVICSIRSMWSSWPTTLSMTCAARCGSPPASCRTSRSRKPTRAPGGRC